MTQFYRSKGGVLLPFAPHILKRQYAELNGSSRMGMKGLYRMQVRRADGSLKTDTGWFDNLITDGGLNRLGTGAAGSTCVIGTGTATPAFTDSALQALAASTTSIPSTQAANSGAPDFYISHTRTFRFDLGALNGNYSEVGVGWANNALFSRALIVDGGGAPLPITVLSDEQLDVIYQLRTYMPLTDWGGTFTIGGVSTTVVGRRHSQSSFSSNASGGGPLTSVIRPTGDNALAYPGPISSAAGGGPSGASQIMLTEAGSGQWTTAAYSNNSNQRESSIAIGLNWGNVSGGIGAIAGIGGESAGHGFYWQYGFTPKIAKDATKTLTLTLAISWGRRP
jgi:hypothetical protein